MKSLGFKKDTIVGESFQIEDRTLYPIVRVYTFKKNFFGAYVCPIALVIVEPPQEYVISLTDETITMEKLLDEVPSLKEKMKKA